MSELLRKGRLKSSRKDIVEFTSSINDDEKILKPVVDINKAHVVMLVEQGIININDGRRILDVLSSIDKGFKFSPEYEDVHMAVEEKVTKVIGPDVGGNLNLAKSRNDQVATAIRMSLREELLCLISILLRLQETLIKKAEKTLDIVIPGYTHLQAAQPITFAHYLISKFDALSRNIERLKQAYDRINFCPMGAGALGTTSFPINRVIIADLLGFDGLVENSLDAVSARDFMLDVFASLSIMAIDVTRFIEDLIIWSTVEFGIIELPDEFASTSSIMPQKKNPEVLEVLRARMGLVISSYMSSTTVLKAIPSGYNTDFQEITPVMWRSINSSKKSLDMLSEIFHGLKVRSNILDKPSLSFITSTELANMLVRDYKVPFRTAHKIVGALVRVLLNEGKWFKDATPDLLVEISKKFLSSPIKVKVEELQKAVDPKSFIKSHKTVGGPSPIEVNRMITSRKYILKLTKKWVSEKRLKMEKATKKLTSRVNSWTIGNDSNRNV